MLTVTNISKTFQIPSEHITTLKERFVALFGNTVRFNELKAVDDVSFHVKPGEWLGIVGRNGSGKSTLLKIIAGIYEADAGTVRAGGHIVPFLELGVGFNEELSVRDNVFLNAVILGMKRVDVAKQFDDLIAFAQLEHFVNAKLKNLSSGMKMRLAFSIAIACEGDIYILDEVFAVGDIDFQKKCFSKLREMKTQNKTIIFVSHNIEQIKKYCDRAVLLHDGHVSDVGIPEEVISTYQAENSQIYSLIHDTPQKPPIWIMGAPRSGTTWLLELLLHHPDTFHLNNEKLELEETVAPWKNAKSKETGLFNRCDSEIAYQKVRELQEKMQKRSVEKTPSHVFHLETILNLWPDALPIVMYRNPHDVVASMLEASKTWAKYWAPSNVEDACSMWNEYVVSSLKYFDSTYSVLYSDLRKDTQNVFKHLLTRLELDDSDSIVEMCVQRTSNGKSIQNMGGVFRKGIVGGYVDSLSPEQIERVTALTNENWNRVFNICNMNKYGESL